jgi:hypothetical protein
MNFKDLYLHESEKNHKNFWINFLKKAQGQETELVFGINEDGSLSIYGGSLEILGLDILHFPFKIKEFRGDLKIVGGKMAFLEGLPKEIKGTLTIKDNDYIRSLDGFPKKVSQLILKNCGVSKLKGTLKEVENNISLIECDRLKNLEFCPKITNKEIYDEILIMSCYKFSSLKGCQDNLNRLHLEDLPEFKTLKDGPKFCNVLIIKRTSLENFEGCPKIEQKMIVDKNKKLKSFKGIDEDLENVLLIDNPLSKKDLENYKYEVKSDKKYNREEINKILGLNDID